ncbi:hypothetical protein B0H10DRAFT_2039461, partial [Mycena sp. CBHHK59/15]
MTVYTFLAVLTILLLVSTAILARSAALRRRERTAVAWAVPGCPHRDAGDAKPTLFEAHVAGPEVDAARDAARAEEQRWHNMKPLSASMSANAPGAPRLPPSSRWHSNSSPTPSLRAAWGEIRRGSGNGFRLDDASSPALGSLPPAEPPPPTPAALRIALIVSMPMPCRIQDDEIPCMEFGVVEADVVDPGKMSSRPDGGISG